MTSRLGIAPSTLAPVPAASPCVLGSQAPAAGRPSPAVAAALAVLLAASPLPCAQTPSTAQSDPSAAAAQAPNPPAKAGLRIVILEGEGALNNIRQRDAREPIVQVQDSNHRPVAGALVLFASNNSAGGAGATFSGATQLTVTTGADGTARAAGFQANKVPGKYTLQVSASYEGMTAEILIHQATFLSALEQTAIQQPLPNSKWIIFGTAAAGGTIIGTVASGLIFGPTSGTQVTAGGGVVGKPGGVRKPGSHP